MTNFYSKSLYYLKERGFTPKIHWLDNETLKGIQDYDKENDINFQLTPPHVHRCNSSERDLLELGKIIFIRNKKCTLTISNLFVGYIDTSRQYNFEFIKKIQDPPRTFSL